MAATRLATTAGAGSAQSAEAGCSAPARSGVGFVVTCSAIGREQAQGHRVWTYRVARHIHLALGRYRVTADGDDKTGTFGNSAPQRKRVIAFRLSQN